MFNGSITKYTTGWELIMFPQNFIQLKVTNIIIIQYTCKKYLNLDSIRTQIKMFVFTLSTLHGINCAYSLKMYIPSLSSQMIQYIYIYIVN